MLSRVGNLVFDVKKLAQLYLAYRSREILRIIYSNASPPITLNQTSILKNIREFYERKKHKSSVVIRGINTDNAVKILDFIDDIYEFLGLPGVQLDDVVQVGSSVWRGDTVYPVQQFRVLSEA